MKQSVGTPVIIAIAVVAALVIGYFAFKTFAPPAMTGGGGANPYGARPDMKGGPTSSGPPAGGSYGHMPGGSGGPATGSSSGPPR